MTGDFAGHMVDPRSPVIERLAQIFERGEYPRDLTRAQLRTIGCALQLLRRSYLAYLGAAVDAETQKNKPAP